MLSEHERDQAIKEGARNAADAAYFNERPHLADDTGIRVFDAGFDRGWGAACAERDARIAELEAATFRDSTALNYWKDKCAGLEQQLAEARKDAMHEAALICDHLDAEVDKYTAACAKAIREAAGVGVASQSDRMVLVPFSIDDCDEIVEAACNAGNLYRVDFIRAWHAAIRAAIKEQT